MPTSKDDADLHEQRIELANRIFTDAEDLTGSEAAEGMLRAINAPDSESLANIEAEFFPEEEDA